MKITTTGLKGTGGIGYDAGLFGNAIRQNGASGAAQNDGFVDVSRSADTLAAGESLSISVK